MTGSLAFFTYSWGMSLLGVAAGTDYGHGDTSSELNAISRSKAMEGLDPLVKRKLVPTIPDDSSGFESRKAMNLKGSGLYFCCP